MHERRSGAVSDAEDPERGERGGGHQDDPDPAENAVRPRAFRAGQIEHANRQCGEDRAKVQEYSGREFVHGVRR